jgi:hypothetical protein
VRRYVPVTVSTYDRKTELYWIKRYRVVRGTYCVWTYWGDFSKFEAEYPEHVERAREARAVTERVLTERRQLLSKFSFDSFDEFLKKDKPEADPKEEFFIRQKRRSLGKRVKTFIENDVPEAELVKI